MIIPTVQFVTKRACNCMLDGRPLADSYIRVLSPTWAARPGSPNVCWHTQSSPDHYPL